MATHLQILLQQLHTILRSTPLLEYQASRPPIIDVDGQGLKADVIPGLRIFKDSIKREVEVLEQFLASNDGSDISTNAPYFIAVWNEMLSAPPPIVAIGKIFDPPRGKAKHSAVRGRKPGGVKVDIVADEGRSWIRVNTINNSRLLAEFREFDSYLIDSGSGSGAEDMQSGREDIFDPTTDKDNSLLKMGHALLTASAVPVPGTNEGPSVTLRLTRLEPTTADGVTDRRIAHTIDCLKSLGINIELGERSFCTLHHDPVSVPSRSALLVPTSRINLDLSMLIALVSDLSHAKMPQSEDEAWSRFRMPAEARTWKLGRKTDGSWDASDDDLSKHSRALSTQCIQEIEHGLIDEIVGRLQMASLLDRAEFWTTKEARDRCLKIVDKIGGPDERRRASALFDEVSNDEEYAQRGRELFWRGSRYTASYFPCFPPIRIYSTVLQTAPACRTLPFWGHLIQTCQHLLSHDVEPHPKLHRKDGEMERAKVTKVNPKLTAHTVESMLVGAWAGMTTLTANKTSVKVILREMATVRQENSESENKALFSEFNHRNNHGGSAEEGSVAAVWIVGPRSLAEGMRVDYLKDRRSD